MQTEVEAKFPDVDAPKLREKLAALGAVRVHEELLMRRKNYDFSNKTLAKLRGWVRVRDEGVKITLSYKQVNDRSLHGTKEATVVVGDFGADNGACPYYRPYYPFPSTGTFCETTLLPSTTSSWTGFSGTTPSDLIRVWAWSLHCAILCLNYQSGSLICGGLVQLLDLGTGSDTLETSESP